MLKIAIIGCGNIFCMHATSASNIPGVKIVGVCDIKKERAVLQAEKYNTKAYFDYKEMIDAEKPDVVHICLPHNLHSVVTEYALLHNVNVLCEKPMALNYDDAVRLVEIAKNKDLKYGVIFQCRYNDAAVAVKKQLNSGRLGKILSARVVLTWNRPDEYYSSSDWKGTWEKEGGGLIINQMIHSLDLAHWFIDSETVEVQSSLHNRKHKKIEVEDTAEGFVRYKNGTCLFFYGTNNYAQDEPIEIRLCCESGLVTMSYDEALIKFNDGEKIKVKQKDDEIKFENGKDYWGVRHISQIRNFYESVILDKTPDITGEKVLSTEKLICDIYDKRK